MTVQGSKSQCPRKQGRSCQAFYDPSQIITYPILLVETTTRSPRFKGRRIKPATWLHCTRSHYTRACEVGDAMQLSLENWCKIMVKYLLSWPAVTWFLWNDYKWKVICLNDLVLKLRFIIMLSILEMKFLIYNSVKRRIFFNLLLYMFISLNSESHKCFLTHITMTKEKMFHIFSTKRFNV